MTERKRKAPKDDAPRPWDEHPISVERWRRHRTLMMQRAQAGRRPVEWWQYERDMERPDQEAAALLAMGELSETELAELTPYWHERYVHAQEPNFAYCLGSKPSDTCASWIEGDAAREAFYRWVGIPDVLIARWDEERRRAAQVISDLAKVAT